MKATPLLNNLGQSICLNDVSRDLLNTGTLREHISDLSEMSLTSNPTNSDHAIKNSSAYDAGIRDELAKGRSGKALFFDLAGDDIARAADKFGPIYDSTNTVDGWTSLEVSTLLEALTPVRSYSQRSWIAS